MWSAFLTAVVCALYGDAAVLRSARSLPSVAQRKPNLNLTFQSLYRGVFGVVNVSVDANLLAIAVDDLSSNEGSRPRPVPHDGMVINLRNGQSVRRMRFFDQVVCMQMSNRAPQNRSASQKAFTARVGALLGAPLAAYGFADDFRGTRSVAGRTCSVWTAHLSTKKHGNKDHVAMLESWEASMRVVWNVLGERKLNVWLNDTTQMTAFMPGPGASSGGRMSFTFCVTDSGEILATSVNQSDIATSNGRTSNREESREVMSASAVVANGQGPADHAFDPSHGAAGPCVDLSPGKRGEAELDADVNDMHRLARIEAEANGQWKASAYEMWAGMSVRDLAPALGTEIVPLRLGLRKVARPSPASIPFGAVVMPPSFDPRRRWPQCESIRRVRNQGKCGSCWAFAATGVLADRFCIAEARRNHTLLSHDLSLSPQHLVECDPTNAGCSGGRLDDAWWFLRDQGVADEACSPYRHCPSPSERHCGFGKNESLRNATKPRTRVHECSRRCLSGAPQRLYRASTAYAVSAPGDVEGLQHELLTHGSVEVGFFVFSDFHSYENGVYFRTPSAFGPLGGHAVRLLGWGTVNASDYWLLANSWSEAWGQRGFFLFKRGTNECGIETTPAAGLPMLGVGVVA